MRLNISLGSFEGLKMGPFLPLSKYKQKFPFVTHFDPHKKLRRKYIKVIFSKNDFSRLFWIIMLSRVEWIKFKERSAIVD